MRRFGLLLAGAAVAIVVAPWALAVPNDVTAEVTAVGWWSSRPTALAQPAGGFEVAAGPDGAPQSVAALRLSIPLTTVTELLVTLDEASSIGRELGGMRLCRTFASWTPANPGAWAAAPTADCSANTVLTRTDEGLWRGDAAALAANGGEVSLMVVPVYTSPVTIGPGMIITVAGGALTAKGTKGTSTTDTTSQQGGTTPTTDFTAGSDFPPVATGSFGSPSFGEPEVVVPTDDPTDPVSPTPNASDDFALDPADSSRSASKPWMRLVLLIPLSAGFGWGSARLRQLSGEGWTITDAETRWGMVMGFFRP